MKQSVPPSPSNENKGESDVSDNEGPYVHYGTGGQSGRNESLWSGHGVGRVNSGNDRN